MTSRTLMLCLALASLPIEVWAEPQHAAFSTSYQMEAKKRFDAAAQSLQPAAKSGNAFAQLRIAWLAYAGGDYPRAAELYGKLTESHPNMIEARLGLMLPLMAQKQWEAAAVQARSVLEQSAWDYNAHVRLLACEEAMEQWDELEAHALTLSLVYPSDATIFVYLARARAQQRNPAGAKEAYGYVLERSPAHKEALAYLKK